MTIKIFQNEINDGIGELVKSTASVAYCAEATVCKNAIAHPESTVVQENSSRE